MNTWRLAWKEWYRSNRSGQPNRDFFWLTVLLFLTLTLALLLWGAREGLLNKFVDVSVGYIEGAGIPIWLAANYGLSGINRDLLQNQALSQQNITLYPYREVEYHEVDLPKQGDNNVWGHTSITEEKVPFNGWAVSFQDPLWKMGMKTPPDSTLPLDIILNRSLFEQYFKCSAYVKALPMPISTDDSDNLGCLANGVLWLDVKVGRNRELLPFRIHWQPHIPTMQNLAFLFPLSTLNTLKMVKRHDTVTFYPEQASDCANQNNRVKELIIWGVSDELMTKLGACLQNPERKHTRLTLKQPLPKSWVAECAEQNGIPIKGKGERRSPPFIQITDELPQPYCFQYDAEDYLTISCQENCQPCQAISTLRERIGERVECSGTKAKIDMIAATGSYQKAFAYVENRSALSIQVDKLKNFRTKPGKPAFYLPSTYDDALVRFRFIDQIMGILQWASSPFFLIFLIILLLVQVGIVINHRKHNYGIFLSKGVSRWQVRGIIVMQITMSFAVAMVFAVLIDESMQWLLAGELESVAAMKPYIDHIIIGQLDLLPLSVLDYFWVGGAVLVVLYIITEISLRLMILKQDREPAYLFD
ncbi:MAG: ABC transporter permease [Pseudomonadota bacterium]